MFQLGRISNWTGRTTDVGLYEEHPIKNIPTINYRMFLKSTKYSPENILLPSAPNLIGSILDV